LLATLFIYFALLLAVARLTGRGGNDAFFRGNRESPWPLVAFGMIGASLSGVTFVSVPGMPMAIDMTYLQMCMGFFFGYLVVAFVLLPIYYRHGVTSIYSYLGERLGRASRKVGAWFFLLSKMAGAAARLYLVCLILEQYAFAGFRHRPPFVAIVLLTLLLIWLYTRRSGIRALVWTDSLQTLCLLLALVVIVVQAAQMLGLGPKETWQAVWESPHSRVFEFGDWASRQHFVKQFLSGIFIVIVMTGLDQDMMQKNLTCRSLRDGQKDLCAYGILFLPVNFLFLALGVLLLLLYQRTGTPLPAQGDQLLPQFVATGLLGRSALIFFTIGIVAAAFSSADSALTALTTSFCIDILEMEETGADGQKDAMNGQEQNERRRKWVHVGVIGVFVLFILAFRAINNSSVIDTIYTLASYTYGPLLGLFAFAIFTRRGLRGRLVPLACVLPPVLCYGLQAAAARWWGYAFGYELLLLNGLLTYVFLLLISKKASKTA